MTPEELAAIERRCKSATAQTSMSKKNFGTAWVPVITGIFTIKKTSFGMSMGFKREEDCVFYFHAREDIPKLLAEVRILRGVLDWYATGRGDNDWLMDRGERARLALGREG